MRIFFFLLLAVVALGAVGGCQSSGGAGKGGERGGGDGGGGGTSGARAGARATGAQMRAQAMAAADIYTGTVAQALDEIRHKTKRREVARWALEQKIATASIAFTNATQASDAASLLDMLVLAKLKRQAVEEYYLPSILHEEGQPLLDAQRRAEADIWELGGKTLTAKQLDELRDLIEQWRREHPTQYYVGLVRLADIAAAKQLTQHSPQVKLPGSVFGLLYLDPLSGLDPVAAELHSYRALTERFMYLATRMPMVFGMQIERATGDASSTPEMQRFLAGVDRFNDTIARFTDVTGKYPQQLSGISVAAIDQTAAAVTAERKAILAELEAQESRLRRITDDVNGVLDRADRAGVSINAATTQTVTTTEQATRRTMDRAFWLALTLILVLLIGIPLAAMLHRFLAARDSRRARAVTSASSP